MFKRFQTWNTDGSLGPAATVDYAFSVINTVQAGPDDFAIGRLSDPIFGITPMVFGLQLPTAGSTVTAWGIGCTDRVNNTPLNLKQYRTYTYPTSDMICQGDSGGPRTTGSSTQSGVLWGINSGYYQPSGGDIVVDATYYGNAVLPAVNYFGVPNQTRGDAGADFPGWAMAAGVRAVSGDFNRDGVTDVALTGPSGWNTIPVAYGDGNGGFSPLNKTVATFPALAPLARSVIAGDFNADGVTDLALVGNSGWSSIPIAFGNGNATFTFSNQPTPTLPALGAAPGAYAVAGDFDDDGDTDIALLGGQGWTSIPIGFSTRDGKFTFSNQQVANFPAWSRTAGARGVVGDFDKDGDDDLALTGPVGWATIPTAFSNRAGGFSVTNTRVLGFPTLGSAETKYVAGDFNGDGKADIVALGGVGWNTIDFALSRGDGAYDFWILPIEFVPALSQRTPFILKDHQGLLLLGGGVQYIGGVHF